MSRVKQTKTNFTAGEISRRLIGRGDLRAYENGALSLCNLFIHPTGGITRRSGTTFVDTLTGDARLISFEFNTDQTYLLVFSNLKIDVYKDDVKVASIVSPYDISKVKKLSWTQSADTLIICHADIAPQILERTSDTDWALRDFQFDSFESYVYQPYHKYAPSDVTIDAYGRTGTVLIVTSEDYFTPEMVGLRMVIPPGEGEITVYESPTRARLKVEREVNSFVTTNWKLQAFSSINGYPSTVAFHQDRLVFGGSRDVPNRLWFSKSGDIYNFDIGEGFDDESISFGILSDQINEITGLFSGRHLQVFTSGAEWMVTGSPLTPETVQVTRQTRVGSNPDINIMPINVDGATLFVARNGKELREFIYTDIEQAYKASDLALLARHIIKAPIDQAYDARNRLLFVVMESGALGVLTVYRDEAVAAWTVLETQGLFKAVTTVGDHVYFLTQRNSTYMIEKLTPDIYLDACLNGQSASPKLAWSGLDHLEGQSVSIVADGKVQNNKTVSSGTITLDAPAQNVTIGLAYTHKIEPLPPSILSPTGGAKAARLIEASFRVEDTAALYLDVGSGLINILDNEQTDGQVPVLLTGDKKIRAQGWTRDMTTSLWKIEQSLPLPFTLLSVTTETKVND